MLGVTHIIVIVHNHIVSIPHELVTSIWGIELIIYIIVGVDVFIAISVIVIPNSLHGTLQKRTLLGRIAACLLIVCHIIILICIPKHARFEIR